jgi:signal peptidase complex subunit 3
VFVYITATYPPKTPTEAPVKSIIWDAILPSKLAPYHQNQYIHPTANPKSKLRRPSKSTRIYSDTDVPGKLKLKGQKPKYVITDHTGSVAGRENVTLELGWNIQPWVGLQTWRVPRDLGLWKGLVGGATEVFAFPDADAKVKVDTVRGGESNRGRPA